MDPYLELRWEGVHPSLTVYARDAIQPQLPDDLWTLAQERVYVASEGEQVRPIVPDAQVSRRYPPPQGGAGVLRDSGVAVAEPLVFELHEPLITEPYLTRRCWTRPTRPAATTTGITASRSTRPCPKPMPRGPRRCCRPRADAEPGSRSGPGRCARAPVRCSVKDTTASRGNCDLPGEFARQEDQRAMGRPRCRPIMATGLG